MEIGTHEVVGGRWAIRETPNGAVELAVECLKGIGEKITAYNYLVAKDGTVNTRSVSNIKEVFGWDGKIESLCDETFDGKPFDIVVEDEPDQNGQLRRRVKWINSRGQAGGASLQMGDVKGIAAKYGAKFRAISGGVPSAKKPAAPVKPPVPKPVAPSATPSTLEACLARLCELQGKNANEEQLESQWFKLQEEANVGVQQGDYTPDQWGKLLQKINEVVMPY